VNLVSHSLMPRVVVGTDLVEISAVAEAIRTFGDRYLRRLFTPDEIATCQATPAMASQRFAARFAAKEATVKVLRPNTGWLSPRDIEITQESSGAPSLILRGEAQTLAAQAGFDGWSVSLTHEAAYASAVVVAIHLSAQTSNDPAPQESEEHETRS